VTVVSSLRAGRGQHLKRIVCEDNDGWRWEPA
jgi:hypothetical protein